LHRSQNFEQVNSLSGRRKKPHDRENHDLSDAENMPCANNHLSLVLITLCQAYRGERWAVQRKAADTE
jgi:hypothetical protein